jgi:hypothetical protein
MPVRQAKSYNQQFKVRSSRCWRMVDPTAQYSPQRHQGANHAFRDRNWLIAITYAWDAVLNLRELLPQIWKNTQNHPVSPYLSRTSSLQPKLEL